MGYSHRGDPSDGSVAVNALTRTRNTDKALQDVANQDGANLLQKQEPAPEHHRYIEGEARVFVAELTGAPVIAPVFWIPNDKSEGFVGVSHILTGAISAVDVRRIPGTEMVSSHYAWMANTSNLVHEMMHHTGLQTRKIIGILDDATKRIDIAAKSGVSCLRIRHDANAPRVYPNGLFFEEACAEEAAAKWREYVEPVRSQCDERHTYPLDAHSYPALPWRYLQTSQALGEESENDDIVSYGFSASAYCSEAMRLISDFTGMDIFDLMLKARNPENEVWAKRQIIQTIEGVQPGLYKKLRDLEYGIDSFIEGYMEVRSAIGARAIN